MKLISSISEKKPGSATDIKIGLWFQFPIPKPDFGCTLIMIGNEGQPNILVPLPEAVLSTEGRGEVTV